MGDNFEEPVVSGVEVPVTQTDKEAMGEILDFFDTPPKTEVAVEGKKEETPVVIVDEKTAQEVEDFSKGNKPETKQEVEVKVETPAKEEEKEDKDSLIASLREEIDRLSALNSRDGKQQLFPSPAEKHIDIPEKKEEDNKREVPATKPSLPLDETLKSLLEKKDFLSKEELDKVIDNPELINDAIHKSRKEMADVFMQALPSMINMAVTREIVIAQAVSSFYTEHEDLRQYSNYVQGIFKEVEKANPDKPYPEIFSMTAKESRKRLGLKEVSKEKPQAAKEEKPAFAGRKGGTDSTINKDGDKGNMFDKAAEELMDIHLY